MIEGNEEPYTASSRFNIPHFPAERNAALLWAVVTIGVVIVAALLNFQLVGIYTTFAPGAVLVLLIGIPIILYLIPQSEKNAPLFDRRMTMIILCWFLLASLVIPILGFSLSSILLAVSLFCLGFVGPFLYLRYGTGYSIGDLGFYIDSKRSIIVSTVITAVYGILVFVQLGFWEWMGFISLVDFGPEVNPFALLPLAFIFGALFSLIAAALPEELVFRTVLQSFFADRKGRVMGILIASLIFGLLHFYVNTLLYQTYYGSAITPTVLVSALIHAFVFQAQAGLIFGVAWERTRSLLLPVMLHTIHNAVEMLPYYLGIMLGIFF